MKKYGFATGNVNKITEVQRIMQKINPDIVIEPFEVTEFDEIQGTPDEISIDKTKKVVKEYWIVLKEFDFDGLFTEDISLHCDGLHGMPGPYIKEVEKNVGLENLSNLVINTGNTAIEASACYTLYKMTDRWAPFKKDYNLFTIKESAKGDIVKPRGVNPIAFGFDSIFQPFGKKETFAEMDESERDQCSYRRLALDKLNNLL
jgi:non-canonical purine NTP pyrophosphatase (RdgB/HAM1 family)